jgi:hypothetical protein
MSNENHYVYLLQTREFINSNQNIYKVGRTKKENLKRFEQYPKGSMLLLQIKCIDCINIENIILKLFRENFEQKKDIGNEYFQGNYKSMIDIIYNIVKNESDNDTSEQPEKSDNDIGQELYNESDKNAIELQVESENDVIQLQKRIDEDERKIKYNHEQEKIEIQRRELLQKESDLRDEYLLIFAKEQPKIKELESSLKQKPIEKKEKKVKEKRAKGGGGGFNQVNKEHEYLKGVKEVCWKEHLIKCEINSVKIIYSYGDFKTNTINSMTTTISKHEKGKAVSVNCWKEQNVTYFNTESNNWRGIGELRDDWRKKNNYVEEE